MIVKIEGPAFKQLIDAVSRFPSVGTFVNSDMVTLKMNDGFLEASMFGVVVANAKVKAEGVLAQCATDERTMIPFASTVVKDSVVTMEVADGAVRLRTRGREIMLSTLPGQENLVPKLKGAKLKISADVATKLNYLSGIAMTDTSKPELCCVMVADGKAMACNQKAVAVMDCAIDGHTGKTALPVPLLKALAKGDVIVAGESTLLESGIGRYMMPSPVAAQEKFPIAMIKKYADVQKKKVAACKGEHFSSALDECSACISNVSRTQVVVTITVKQNKIELAAKNGGVAFRRVIPCNSTVETKLIVPLEEAILASPLFGTKELHVYNGTNDETILAFADGWVLFPSWTPSK